jgi:hypothetical protein
VCHTLFLSPHKNNTSFLFAFSLKNIAFLSIVVKNMVHLKTNLKKKGAVKHTKSAD